MTSLRPKTDFSGHWVNSLSSAASLTPSGFERALRLQSETGERADLLLTKLGQVSERDLADALSTQLKLPIVETCDYPVEPVLTDRLSAKFLQEFRVLPLSDSPRWHCSCHGGSA